MCGIAGILGRPEVDSTPGQDATRRMLRQMQRRGPDAEGLWSGRKIVLGHRRLAIVDLDSRSNQPMLSADGRYAIVFNGEIYNFKELRRGLEARGVAFSTASDTEVLLNMFARLGPDMLPSLRGMFALAIWDSREDRLFLARDPYGIKPLYYAWTDNAVLFASQVKGLLASGLVGHTIEPAGVAGFYLWGSVPEPWTLYRDVFALPAGHSLTIGAGQAGVPACWSDIRRFWQSPETTTNGDLGVHVREALKDSVRAHLVADVPVSVFLSGGVDSAVVAALAAELGSPVEGITLGFDEYSGETTDEVPVASAIAAHYGMRHFVRRVSGSEFTADIPMILDAMDQPSVDGVNTWFVSKAAAERGYKVALSGVGGDELFCGYSTFIQVPRLAAIGRAIAAVPGMRGLLAGSARLLPRSFTHPKIAGLAGLTGSLADAYRLSRGLFLVEELPGLMGPEAAREGLVRLGTAGADEGRDSASTVGMFESSLYLRNQLLRDSDWASMHHSLELRTPMVDARLLQTLAPYMAGFTRGAGKVMVSRSPRKPLPDRVLERGKVGFSIPIAKWLQGVRASAVTTTTTASKSNPWARDWAVTVMDRIGECASFT